LLATSALTGGLLVVWCIGHGGGVWRLVIQSAQPSPEADPAIAFFLEAAVRSSKVISVSTAAGGRAA